ncbi:hypothetical protein [Flavobacterium sp. N1736]|uniref:hypothetical protein n=1 Tax=Flavobacterium sp. N1736 TaxID=2986823 RepID=UPI002224A0B4|nr:hypothetical protein [Flavobacterium sp. N1736]
MKKLQLNQMENLEAGGPQRVTHDAAYQESDAGGGGCSGSNVVGCMTDVYTNHGWGSVVATLSTAFLPQTAVAFALACAAKNGC